MNSCEKTRLAFHDALSSGGAELPPDALAHLAECPDCRAEYAEFEGLEDDLRAVAAHDPELPARLHSHIMEAIAAEPDLRRRKRSVLLPIGMAAAAVAVFLLPLTLMQNPLKSPAAAEPITLTIPTITIAPEMLAAETMLADSGRPYASTANGFYALAASTGRLVEALPEATPLPCVE